MGNNRRMDLTTGKPIRQILLFSLPLVMGSLFQQLYSFVDTIMVGRLISNDALAAVGSVSSLNFLVIGFVGGTCSGFTIPLAKAIGAKNTVEFQKYLWNGCWICLMLAALMTLLTNGLTHFLLELINTPEDIFEQSASYIRILFCGIPITILYNYTSGILRASGDSQRPTNHLLISSLLNIILDYICIVPLSMGVWRSCGNCFQPAGQWIAESAVDRIQDRSSEGQPGTEKSFRLSPGAAVQNRFPHGL